MTSRRSDPADSRDWATQGACTNYDPQLWHPEGTSRSNRPDWNMPRQVCDYECQVKAECRAWALSDPDPSEGEGMWGGLTPFERAEIRSDRRASA